MFPRFRLPHSKPTETTPNAEANRLSQREQHLLEHTLEAQAEHPLFETGNSLQNASFNGGKGDESYLTDADATQSRARAWELDTQRLFLRRTQVLCLLAIVVTPFFWFFYTRVNPQALGSISLTQLMLVAASLVIFWMARYSPSQLFTRVLAVLLYCAFGWAAAVAVAMASSGERDLSAFSGHQQILISILFMPFSLMEAAICATLVTLSFTFGLGNALSLDEWPDFVPHIISFAVSGLMISLMAHLQNSVRRRAFDSNFDIALSAARNAQLSTLDSITGGWNRRYLEIALNKELKRVARFRQPAALLMFDLDNFKRVNDQLGHPVGDTVLREVHNAALATLRNIDTIARYGGDEFAVIMPGLKMQDAVQTATRLSDSVSQHLVGKFGAESLQGQVTLSIGVTALPAGEVLSSIEAIQRADERLYEAKRAGKNRIRVG